MSKYKRLITGTFAAAVAVTTLAPAVQAGSLPLQSTAQPMLKSSPLVASPSFRDKFVAGRTNPVVNPGSPVQEPFVKDDFDPGKGHGWVNSPRHIGGLGSTVNPAAGVNVLQSYKSNILGTR